jgi:predicted DCC family thiol-disulfide oxidoreductase YuxK
MYDRMKDQGKDNSIVLFDGFCNFCSRSVWFIIRRDPGRKFLFAASQSPGGQKLIREYAIGEMADHSIVLVRGGRVFSNSGAALRIAGQLRFPWSLFQAFIILPPGLRDFFYGLIARNRYRLYGKRDECFLPGPEIRERFLDG